MNAQVFKFRPINKYTISSLVNSELYFAPPKQLNDPFDCNVNIYKSLEKAISIATDEVEKRLIKLKKHEDYFSTIQKKLLTYGVCSFSTDLLNPLLWSHYSEDHRGLCLLYDIPDGFIVDGPDRIAGMARVVYEENPLTAWFLNISEELLASGAIAFGSELMKKLFTIKAPCWSYENEVRILRNGVGRLSIDKSFLKQICFGLNSADEDIQTIRRIIENNGHEVTFCKIQRNDDDFGIEAIEI